MITTRRRKPVPSKRSKLACSVCRSRKVRCDLVIRGDTQCTNCFLDQKKCIIAPGRRPKGKPPGEVSRPATIDLKIPSHLSGAQIRGLRNKEAISLPPESVLNTLLACFVDFVHPQLPFLDLRQLHGDVPAMISAGTFSLFVLHALLATTFPHVDGNILQSLGFSNAREASKCYQTKAVSLLGVEYEQNEQNIIQGLLLLSLSTRNAIDDSDRGASYITEAISRARKAEYHLGESARPRMDMASRRSTRRLWWSCYVQDRLSNLLTGHRPCVADEEITIEPLLLEDFDFYHITRSNIDARSALAKDTLSQIFLVYLFKWKVELCQYLTSAPTDGSDLSQKIGDRMDVWYDQVLECVSSQTLNSQSLRCLNIHWDSLVLLYQTIVLLIARKRWIFELQGRLRCFDDNIGSDDTFSPPDPLFLLKEALKKVAELASQFLHREQMQHIGNGGLWALLPAMMTIAQILTSKSGDLHADTYREIYIDCLLILESQADCFEAVASTLPLVRELLSTLNSQPLSPGIPFSDCGSGSPEVNCDPFEPVSTIYWDNSLMNDEQTFTLSQISLCFGTGTIAEVDTGSTASDF